MTVLHILLVSAMTAGSALKLTAQAGSQRDQLASSPDCAHLASLEHGNRPERAYRLAMENAARCPDEGGAALASAWMHAPGDTTYLNALVYSSDQLRDDRVLSAVLRTARDEVRPTYARLAALRVLASYVDSTVAVDFAGIAPATRWGAVISNRDHVVLVRGAVPVGTAGRGRILDTFESLASGDRDRQVRLAARILRDYFRHVSSRSP